MLDNTNKLSKFILSGLYPRLTLIQLKLTCCSIQNCLGLLITLWVYSYRCVLIKYRQTKYSLFLPINQGGYVQIQAWHYCCAHQNSDSFNTGCRGWICPSDGHRMTLKFVLCFTHWEIWGMCVVWTCFVPFPCIQSFELLCKHCPLSLHLSLTK